MNWKNYFKIHIDREPRPQLLKALDFSLKGKALDLGSGTFNETKLLLEHFGEVVAVDSSPDVPDFKHPNLKFYNVDFKDYDFPADTFDLINAEFSLPFYGKDGFGYFFEKILKSLKKDGVFSGNLFGVNDSWNTPDSKLFFHSSKELDYLFENVEMIFFNEEEKYGTSANGDIKHWHIFNFIIKK